ncbi:PadR family transcriptional regulator [Yinghuangia soli]|uniref:PadR family transcriptional regulator n=1 Tax=Yinghuangia soli TaxID=2908204 RepID=A0AA41QBT0_9ACTN|nr:PadR family transcriptional regulator [Yinghuangia soli]MCF2533892.1 PadR family transcriptional regulator [Yinghuangia soli]
MSRRGGVLEFATLGLLHDTPMHGYELRKRLNTVLGTFRAIAYGTLYPCLRSLLERGLIVEEEPEQVAAALAGGKRARIVYKLTAQGKEHFQELLSESGSQAWEDENFGVHFAFFGRTDREVRMRILEGRRGKLEERLDRVRSSLSNTREKLDGYTLELQRHGLESVEREVRWLNELISAERHAGDDPVADGTGTNDAGAPRQTKQDAASDPSAATS